MINVTIYKDSANEYVGFKFLGHAESARYGKDIVCAAVSTLVLNTINSIESFTHDEFNLDTDEASGYIEFHLKGKISAESKLLMNSLVLGITGILEDGNKKFISIVFKEV